MRTTIIVNGRPTKVKAKTKKKAVRRALKQTGSAGPRARYELRDEDGVIVGENGEKNPFDHHRGGLLYLSVKAGVGGSVAA